MYGVSVGTPWQFQVSVIREHQHLHRQHQGLYTQNNGVHHPHRIHHMVKEKRHRIQLTGGDQLMVIAVGIGDTFGARVNPFEAVFIQGLHEH